MNSTSTVSIADILPHGVYTVFLQTSTNNASCASAYIVTIQSSAIIVNPIMEGEHANAPRITASGIMRLHALDESRSVVYGAVKMG